MRAVYADRAAVGAALCVVAEAGWMLPVPAVHGDVAGGALMLAIVMALVVSGWLSAWSTVFVLVAPVLGEVSDMLGLASPGGDVTAFATGLFIVAPISAALIGLGVGLRAVRRRFRSAHGRGPATST